VMAFHEIENLVPMKELADKTKMIHNLLKGQALSHFEHHFSRRLEAEDSEPPDNELIELVLRDVGLEYIPKCCIYMQEYHMRRGLNMGLNMSIQQFVERLNGLNCYVFFMKKTPRS
jgi:hypothetical protein